MGNAGIFLVLFFWLYFGGLHGVALGLGGGRVLFVFEGREKIERKAGGRGEEGRRKEGIGERGRRGERWGRERRV